MSLIREVLPPRPAPRLSDLVFNLVSPTQMGAAMLRALCLLIVLSVFLSFFGSPS